MEGGKKKTESDLQARISNVTTTLMEGHNSLDLEAMAFNHGKEIGIARPVIDTRHIPLDHAPPHINHDTFHACALQSHQARIHSSPPVHYCLIAIGFAYTV